MRVQYPVEEFRSQPRISVYRAKHPVSRPREELSFIEICQIHLPTRSNQNHTKNSDDYIYAASDSNLNTSAVYFHLVKLPGLWLYSTRVHLINFFKKRNYIYNRHSIIRERIITFYGLSMVFLYFILLVF